MPGQALGRRFRWLWASYAVSAYGTALGFGAFALIAVVVLHAGAAQVSALAAVGPAVGALLAVPLGPWVEARRSAAVMIGMDLVRFAAMISVPLAYALGWLGFAHLLIVSIVAAAAKIAFNAASGARLKELVRSADLVVANARFESTNWSSLALGPPLGGAAIGLFGPVTTVLADAVSYLLSAGGVAASRDRAAERDPSAARDRTDHVTGNSPRAGGTAGPDHHDMPATGRRPLRADQPGGVFEGWRHLWAHPELRALFVNQMLVNGLIMATEPLLAVLLLGEFGMPAWQYGLAFAAPCLGGLIGSRLARRVVARRGQRWVFRVIGTTRALWLVGLAFVQPGIGGLITVMVVELAIIISMSLYSPVLAAYRLERTPRDRVARTLTAWSISTSAAIAALTALGGLLADATSPRTAIAVAGLLILATPLLLVGGTSTA